MRFLARLVQWPVGQGGFATGEIQHGNARVQKFSYVFDCGSNSLSALRGAISGHDSETIDLLFASHLDSDHINGIENLAARYSIETVVLPYLDWFALFSTVGRALGNGSYTQTLAELLVDPRQWFAKRGIRNVLLVERSPGGDVPPANLEVQATIDPGGGPVRDGDEKNERTTLAARLPYEALYRATFFNGAREVMLLKTGYPFTVISGNARLWVLAPFVPPVEPSRLRAFRQVLVQIGLFKPRQQRLRTAEVLAFLTDRTRRKQLKQAYQSISNDHNRVSLSLYSGPLQSSALAGARGLFLVEGRHGWMYTGDTPLGTEDVATTWTSFYRSLLPSVGVLVAPHHGSRFSFSHDVLLNVRPEAALFVFGRKNGYGHPHGEVVSMFALAGAQICGVTEASKTIVAVDLSI